LSQFVLFITNIQSNGLIVLDDPSSSIKVWCQSILPSIFHPKSIVSLSIL
jgi:hypothetical protein